MTRTELVQRIRKLSKEMIDLGLEMDDFGGMPEIAQHGAELVGAGHIAETWADGIEAEDEI